MDANVVLKPPVRLPAFKPDRPYSLSQFAELVGVAHKTVARWRISGIRRPGASERTRLPCYRAGGAWRVMGADALAWLRLMSAPAAQDDAPPASPVYAARRRARDVDALLDAAGF